MKIRITKKGLPKAQWLNSQYPPNSFGNFNLPKASNWTEGIWPYKTFDIENIPNAATSIPATDKENKGPLPDMGGSYVWKNFNTGVAPTPRYEVVNADGSKEQVGNFGDAKTFYKTANDAPTISDFKIPKPDIKRDYIADFQKVGNIIKGASILGSSIMDDVNRKKRDADFSKWKRNQMNSDALFNAVEGSDGDYVTTGSRFGEFRPNDYVVNKGMFAQYGGENQEIMKIRITKQPSMAYGGQSNYGLDLGRRSSETDMPESMSDSYSSSISAVPRSMANIEAEGGETVYGDLDSDGMMEHMKIHGKRHSEGGVPLNVPEGSFIFSDTKKMKIKDPEILKNFGMSFKKGGYTPATIAKKFPINKYKAILEDPNEDDLNKDTASLMIKNYNDKLSYLAMVQESIKGFPQGIPKVAQASIDQNQQQLTEAKYGGYLPRFQGTGNSQVTVQKKDTPVIYAQTLSPKQFADISDPDFQKYMDLLKQYDKKSVKGAYFLKDNLPEDVARELAQLATKFGFSRKDEKGKNIFRVIQGSNPEYSFASPTKADVNRRSGFFGGFTPQLYERRVVEDILGTDAVKNMSELDIRKAYFKELGVDISGMSDDQLKDTKSLYNNKDFFSSKFYPKFTTLFGQSDYRTMLGDDQKIGAEHYDSYRTKEKETKEKTVPGFTCQGLDASGVPIILSSPFKDEQSRAAAGAYASRQEASLHCPQGEIPSSEDTVYEPPREVPFQYMTPDLVNIASTAFNKPKKYFPYRASVNLPTAKPTFFDPNREIAAQNEAANMLAQSAALIGNPQAYMANASKLQGSLGEGVANTIGRVQNQNVGVANQFAGINADIIGKNNMLAAQRANELGDLTTTLNQNYDNAKRNWQRDLATQYGNAWNNRMKLNLMNLAIPMFNIDPRTGKSLFTNRGYGFDMLGNRGSSNAASMNFMQLKNKLMQDGYSESFAERKADAIMSGGNPLTSYTDANNDGFPDRVSTTQRGIPMNYMSSLMSMMNMFNKYGGTTYYNPFEE